ncbi:hypothetical protein ABT097_12625 [Streptomyces sp. NPDC002225]|uniref:hypothetical protein n=1 Tax=Streptomyces sp. NPDC002225 TaxID=3154413 RepID=UPI00332FC782
MSDTQRMNESLKLFKGYRTFRVKGEYRSEMSVRADLRVDRRGRCVGTFRTTGSAEIIVIGSRTWIREGEDLRQENRAFARNFLPEKLAAFDKALAKTRGKYIEYRTRDMGDGGVMALCHPDKAMESVPEKVHGAKRTGNPRTQYGVRTVQLTHGSGTGEVSVHVAEKGGNEPRGIEFTADGNPVILELGEYDKQVDVKPPSPSKVVHAKDVPDLDLISALPDD